MEDAKSIIPIPAAGAVIVEKPNPLLDRYLAVRRLTEKLAEDLSPEDCVVQSMPDVSPTKWHLAHTSWFFETFVLQAFLSGFRPLHPGYAFLFNSYYVHAGERHCRAQRGYISRPSLREVLKYRAEVDDAMIQLLGGADDEWLPVLSVIELGINHEQQHQELILTDIKHVLSVNPLRPPYREIEKHADTGRPDVAWIEFPKRIGWIGCPDDRFAYDNEGPRHQEIVYPFKLANRTVVNGEYHDFIRDGGYRRPELWLSAGWECVARNGWTEPFYWENRDGEWWTYTLGGLRPVNMSEPVCHISYYEADAFARWSSARLPTESEWEVAAADVRLAGNFVESERFHPVPPHQDAALQQMFGNVWEWTRSPYTAYPGYQPAAGALGEYNGKFMCNQFVLRGGSCATPSSHIRRTYRNFFHPEATWQFSGFRLAMDV